MSTTAMMPATTPDRFVTQCLEHLQQEADVLAILITALRAVRSALARNDTQALASLLEDQRAAMDRLVIVRQQRREFRQCLARRLGVAEHQATISQWAVLLPAAAQQQVTACRDYVAGLAIEAAELTATNMAVLTTTMQLFGEVLSCLTGEKECGIRYSSDGVQQPHDRNHLLNQRI